MNFLALRRYQLFEYLIGGHAPYVTMAGVFFFTLQEMFLWNVEIIHYTLVA